MGILVVYQVINNLHVVVVPIGAVLLAQIALYHHSQFILFTKYFMAAILRVHPLGFIAKRALLRGVMGEEVVVARPELVGA